MAIVLLYKILVGLVWFANSNSVYNVMSLYSTVPVNV